MKSPDRLFRQDRSDRTWRYCRRNLRADVEPVRGISQAPIEHEIAGVKLTVAQDQEKRGSAPEYRLHIVAIRIEHEGRIVTGRITFGGVTKAGLAIIGPARLQGCRIEGVDLSAVPGGEGRMLLDAMRVKAVNP